MKKITAMLLALFMLIGVLAGCGKQSDDKSDKTDKTDKLSIRTMKAGLKRSGCMFA